MQTRGDSIDKKDYFEADFIQDFTMTHEDMIDKKDQTTWSR